MRALTETPRRDPLLLDGMLEQEWQNMNQEPRTDHTENTKKEQNKKSHNKKSCAQNLSYQ